MDILIFLVWAGGTMQDHGGFWRAMFWPYYFGKVVVIRYGIAVEV